jgi:hypothetical protein
MDNAAAAPASGNHTGQTRVADPVHRSGMPPICPARPAGVPIWAHCYGGIVSNYLAGPSLRFAAGDDMYVSVRGAVPCEAVCREESGGPGHGRTAG